MQKPFIYGQAVSGQNFTDRKSETARLVANFTHGINTILISPRRLGKTSLVKKAISCIDSKGDIPVFLDIYDCRDEYDFYERLSTSILKATSSSIDSLMKSVTEFIGRVAPKISVSPDGGMSDYSLSLGLAPKDYSPEEILDLAEKIARKRHKHLIICIDEFQQIGEFPNSLDVQKKMRGIWQHQENVTYCFFGSKKHMMEKIFSDRSMPFFQFGEMIHLGKIDTAEWVEYISRQFSEGGKEISAKLAASLCESVDNYSSYVQQLSWNLFVLTEKSATEEDLKQAIMDTLVQNSSLFTEQIRGLSTFQMNFLKAVAGGLHNGFTSGKVLSSYRLGSKSNIKVIIDSLREKELVEVTDDGIYLSDPVFQKWILALSR